jgi:hypothetical protein
VEVAVGAVDGEAALAHGRKMGSAREEVDLGSNLTESRAEIATDAAAANDCNSHGEDFTPGRV